MHPRLLLAAFTLAIPAAASAAVAVNGRWYTEGRESIVEIGPCGTEICGRVARILKPRPDGKPALDYNNPDPAQRSRPVLGMTILSGFRDAGNEWSGRIYDPRAGKSYRSTLVKMKDGTLKVKGCVGPFCRAVSFTPVN